MAKRTVRKGDKRECEDFEEYKKSAEKRFGYRLVRMTACPFEAIFDVGGAYGKFWVSRKRGFYSSICEEVARRKGIV